jgi:hypothetical protein
MLLNSIDQLIFVIDMYYVLFEVGNEFLNIKMMNVLQRVNGYLQLYYKSEFPYL